ncbi:MAG TPA: hypothetical protein ACFCUC_11520, partial [Desulfobacterales bacterium]
TSGDGGPGTGVSAAVRVSGTPTIGGLGSVNAFAWAPDSSRIAYLARQETTAQELFTTTPESDADNVKVSGPLTDGANVDLFAWSPNLAITNRIAYLADQDKINVPELYTSRPDGSANQNVSGPLDPGGRVREFFEWVPPSVQPDTLIFLARKDDFRKVELYASSDDGLSITKLSDPLIDGGDVVDFAISPDGQLVAYKADAEFDGRFELFTVPVNRGSVVNVSRRSNNVLNVVDFAWAPDSSRIAFTAQNELSGNTGGNVELFTNRPRAIDPFRVSINLPFNGNVSDFRWSPNQSLIAYTASATGGLPNKFELFSTRPDSQDNNKISGFLPNLSSVGAFAWSPNGRLVAFLADFNAVGINELLVTDPTVVFPTPVAVSGTLVTGGAVVSFQWAPNGSRIAYLADQFEDEKFELISVFPDIANPLTPNIDLRRLSGRDLQGDVVQFDWAPNASRIAYIADQEVFGVFELFTNTPRGNSNIKVSGALVAGGEVKDFAWAPNSALIAYQANQNNVNIDELFTTGPR